MSFWEDGAPDGDAPATADPRRERPGGRVVVGVLVLLVALLAGGYVAAYYTAGDKVPRGTVVGGVEIGGLSRAAAENELRAAFESRAGNPIDVSVEGGASASRADEVDPTDVGLEVDYAATLDDAGAVRSWSPGRQWDYFLGTDEVAPVVDVDQDALDAELARLSEGLGTPPVDGRVVFRPSGPVGRDSVDGQAIDTDAASEALVQAYLTDGDAVSLSVEPAEADIDDADVQAALDEFANPAMAAPVVLDFGGETVRLAPTRFARVLSMVPEAGVLVPQVDEQRLSRLVRSAATGDEPVGATVELVDGEPEVVPAEPGVTFEPADVAATFLEAVAAEGDAREGTVRSRVDRPEVTTADARALGIVRRVSNATTYFPYAEYRNVNIGRAGELIDGTLLLPGETFSMNDVVGERTVENGFTTGTVISDGIFVEDLGGGVSQMATTTFNAAFFAGLEDVEHKPHSVYIDRYPVGREATVAFGSVDLRFTNDTDYGVLIDVEVTPSTPSSQGVANVSMYSTKVWDITSRESERYDYVSPGTQTLRTENCLPNTGYSGFSIDVWREFREPGSEELVREEKFHTDYIASDTIICKPPRG